MEIKYGSVFEYLYKGTFPDCSSDNSKRAIRSKAKKFQIQDGMLHYVSKEGLRQWITDPEQQRKIIHACHVDKL